MTERMKQMITATALADGYTPEDVEDILEVCDKFQLFQEEL